MLRLSKRSKACDFSPKVRKVIRERDNGCFFCRIGYHLELANHLDMQVMHFVSRAHGGLGIEQNGALGCAGHHDELDNGNKGLRSEMLGMMEEYLKGIYPDWSKEDLIYQKDKL